MGASGTGSFENEAAGDWFYVVEEAVEPGEVIAAALDDALAEPGELEVDLACQAIAAAELSASCAGAVADDLPEHVRMWVLEHPHEPHPPEIEQAVQAVERVGADSELRALWAESDGPDNAWLLRLEELIVRLRRAGTDTPADLHP